MVDAKTTFCEYKSCRPSCLLRGRVSTKDPLPTGDQPQQRVSSFLCSPVGVAETAVACCAHQVYSEDAVNFRQLDALDFRHTVVSPNLCTPGNHAASAR